MGWPFEDPTARKGGREGGRVSRKDRVKVVVVVWRCIGKGLGGGGVRRGEREVKREGWKGGKEGGKISRKDRVMIVV